MENWRRVVGFFLVALFIGFLYTFITNIAHNDHVEVSVEGLSDITAEIHKSLHRQMTSDLDRNLQHDLVWHNSFCDRTRWANIVEDYEWVGDIDWRDRDQFCTEFSYAANELNDAINMYPEEDIMAGEEEAAELRSRFLALHGDSGRRMLREHITDHIQQPDYHKNYNEHLHGVLLNETHHDMLHDRQLRDGRQLFALSSLTTEQLVKRMSHFRRYVMSNAAYKYRTKLNTNKGVDFVSGMQPFLIKEDSSNWEDACKTGICSDYSRIDPESGDTITVDGLTAQPTAAAAASPSGRRLNSDAPTSVNNALGSRFAEGTGFIAAFFRALKTVEVTRPPFRPGIRNPLTGERIGGPRRMLSSDDDTNSLSMGIREDKIALPFVFENDRKLSGFSSLERTGQNKLMLSDGLKTVLDDTDGLRFLTSAEMDKNKEIATATYGGGANVADPVGEKATQLTLYFEPQSSVDCGNGELCSHKARRLSDGLIHAGRKLSVKEHRELFIFTGLIAGITAIAAKIGGAAVGAKAAVAGAAAAVQGVGVAEGIKIAAAVAGASGGISTAICNTQCCKECN